MNIGNAIKEAVLVLEENNIKSSKIDSEILMSKVFNNDRKSLILNFEKEINKKKLYHFKNLIKLRSIGKPIAYLTGKKDFWKNEFEINEHVLIPRPDTEIVVEKVLEVVKNKKKMNILDIGVGSGCILLSILNEKKDFYGVGIDISKNCLSLCKINAGKLSLTNRVKFFKTDVDNFKYGKYDLIISNPPYINLKDLKYLERDIRCFEPKIALNGGLDGLSEIRKVINRSSELIKTNGKLILEIGFDQKNRVKELLIKKGFYINKIFKDYAKNDRCIVSTKL